VFGRKKKNHENEKITQKITRKQTKLRKKKKRLILQRSHTMHVFCDILLFRGGRFFFNRYFLVGNNNSYCI